jgi:Tol biopolymer transport system component
MKGVVYHGNSINVAVDYNYELVSRSNDETFSSFYESGDPAVGGMGAEEGRYVVFVSWTKGFAGNDGKYRQIFWRDRNTGITKMVSAATDGTPGNESSAMPSISADGQTVVFESNATNLVSGDENKARDVFSWSAKTGKVERVSIPEQGGWGNGNSYDAMVSGDGQQVVFTSDAANMTTIPKGRSQSNVFIRNLLKGVTEMLSVEPVSQTGGNAQKGSISFDGSRVVFCSPTPTLVANDNNKLWDIFLWERGKQGLRRISLTQGGTERNQGEESGSRRVAASISGNGRFVVYSTTASNMVPGDQLKFQDVFVFDIETGKLQVASFTADGKPGNHDSPIEQGDRLAITYDGTWVVFPTKATNLGVQGSNLLLYNTQTGKKQVVTDTKGSYVGRPAISYAGSYVVFGKSEALDRRGGIAFGSSGGGIFAHFTGLGSCRACGW